MGIVTIAVTGYSYLKKRGEGGVSVAPMAKGAALSGVGMALFAVLGFPVLVELVVVLAATALLKKHVLDNQAIADLLRRHLASSKLGLEASASKVRALLA
jgi:hypothetical protein